MKPKKKNKRTKKIKKKKKKKIVNGYYFDGTVTHTLYEDHWSKK